MQANQQTQQRFDFLMQRNYNSNLSLEEEQELDHFIALERLFRLAKMRADGLRIPSLPEI